MSTNKNQNKAKAKKSTSSMEGMLDTYHQHRSKINMAVIVLLAVLLGGLMVKYLYLEPREVEAATSMATAQRYFEMDSLQKAMEGDGQHLGFQRIMKKYSGTDAGNLSQYYAGVIHLKQANYDQAITLLEKFDGSGTLVQYAAWGALGDAYMEKGNLEAGIRSYLKAAGNKNNAFYTPLYLYRAGVAYELAGKPQEAIKVFERIRDEYPQSAQAQEMDKALAKLGVVQ